jgi:ADP-heptose:LPS heptosyltransferase
LHADTLVYLTASRGLRAAWRDHAFFTLCGFKRIIGIPLSEDLQAHRRQSDGSLEPECERLRRCLAPLSPLSLDDPAAWNLKLSASEWAAAAAALAPAAGAPRLAINMGGKVAINDWGEARWSALIGRLRGLLDGHALTIVGSAEDAGRAERVGAGWPGPVLNLCGRLPPRVTAAALSGSALFIGHNSGPLHLASCVGVPCVGLYGNHFAPRIWHPYGGPAAGDRHRILHDMRGVEHLTVEQVLDAILAALAPVPRRVEPRALSVVSVVGPAGPPSPTSATSATSATSVASLAAAVGGAGS